MNGYTIMAPDGSSKAAFLSLPVERVQTEACIALKNAGDGHKAFIHNHSGNAILCFVNKEGVLLPRNPTAFGVEPLIYS